MMGSLVAVTGLRQFFADPIENASVNAAWFVIQLTPMLVTLPGVLRGALNPVFILCLASTLYFIHGVMLAFDPELWAFGWAEIAFSLGLCAATAKMVRTLRELAAR